MRTVIEEYRHAPGVHCISTVFSNIFRHQGLELTEDMCVGLGSGIGFTYLPADPIAVVLGRGDDLEIRLCEALDVQIYIRQDWDTERSWREVCERLKAGVPVVLDLDVVQLSHLRPFIKDPDRSDLGGHKMVLVGYDDALGEAYLYDYMWSRRLTIPQEEIKAAWRSPVRASPSKNYWYEIFLPQQPASLKAALRRAFRWTYQSMTAPWTHYHGLPALERFVNEVAHWPAMLGPDMAAASAYNAYLALEVTGSGRSAFRRMYGRFLGEAAERLEDPFLAAMSADYLRLSRSWTKLAGELKAAAETGTGIFEETEEKRNFLCSILYAERQCIDKHVEWICQCTTSEMDKG